MPPRLMRSRSETSRMIGGRFGVESDEQPARPSTPAGSGRRFCPRCGTARSGDMPFCPACGLDLTQPDESDQAAPDQAPADLAASDLPASDLAAESSSPIGRLRIPPLAVVVVLVLVGLFVLGLLPRLPFGNSP